MNGLIAVYIVLIFSSVLAFNFTKSDEQFALWMASQNRTYQSETAHRRGLLAFLENAAFAAAHTSRLFKTIPNKFADILSADFTRLRNGFRRPVEKGGMTAAAISWDNIPENVDWSTTGAVSPVQEQGECGACWAFSACGALEGAWFLKYGTAVELSVQHMIDCAYGDQFGCYGCDGGDMDSAFNWLLWNGFMRSAQDYQHLYQEKRESCYNLPIVSRLSLYRWQKARRNPHIKGFVDLPRDDEQTLKAAVAKYGPVAVAIDGSSPLLQIYSTGVYDDPNCNASDLNHAVLLVGYGTDDKTNQPYWKIKNSWGGDWGEGGYFRLSRNANNMCGVASWASYAYC